MAELDLSPPQPDEVTRAVALVLAESERAPDPWWQAGIDESLGT